MLSGGPGDWLGDAAGALHVPPAADNLGTVDYLQRAFGDSVEANEWFRFAPLRDGILTAELASPPVGDDAGMVLFGEDEAGQLEELAAGTTRLDYEASGGDRYVLLVAGAPPGDELVLANLVQQAGGQVTVFGTDGDDQFELAASPSRLVTINGVGYHFDPAEVFSIGFDGAAGNNTAALTGSAGEETVRIRPTTATMRGAGLEVTVGNAAEMTVHSGGGSDAAFLYDSAGNDVFTATPSEAALSGPGYANQAVGFQAVYAIARYGGFDRAYLHDSPGDDRFVARPAYAKLDGDGFLQYAKWFERVDAYATAGGFDAAWLFDSAGDDSFVATSVVGKLVGNGFYNRTRFFDAVYGCSAGQGWDTASLTDSGGDDVLEADARWVQLSNAQEPLLRRVSGFDRAVVTATNPGNSVDIAPTTVLKLGLRGPGVVRSINAADFFDPASPTLGIQAAINAVPPEGGVVTVPAGRWPLHSSLVLRSNVILQGEGAATVITRGAQVRVQLVQPANRGDLSIEVESTAGFRIGDEVALAQFGMHRDEVELHTITGIEPGRLIFAEPVVTELGLSPERGAAVVNCFPAVRGGWYHHGLPARQVTIRDLSIDGNAAENPSFWYAKMPSAIDLIGSDDALLSNCTIRWSLGSGIHLDHSQGNRIEDCLIKDARYAGIFLEEVSHATIRDSTARRSGRGGNGVGIALFGGHDNRVEGCLLEYNRGDGLHPGNDIRDSVFTGNVSRYNERNGLYFCWNILRVTVSENLFHDNGIDGIGGLGPGGAYGDRLNVVENNVCRNNARYGIKASNGRDNTIIGNTVLDNSQDEPGRYSGIYLTGSESMVVTGNRSGGEAARATQKFGIEEGYLSNHNLIAENACQGNLEGGILIVGRDTEVVDNLAVVVYAL